MPICLRIHCTFRGISPLEILSVSLFIWWTLIQYIDLSSEKHATGYRLLKRKLSRWRGTIDLSLKALCVCRYREISMVKLFVGNYSVDSNEICCFLPWRSPATFLRFSQKLNCLCKTPLRYSYCSSVLKLHCVTLSNMIFSMQFKKGVGQKRSARKVKHESTQVSRECQAWIRSEL